jgi:hypothetical protein
VLDSRSEQEDIQQDQAKDQQGYYEKSDRCSRSDAEQDRTLRVRDYRNEVVGLSQAGTAQNQGWL